MHYLFMQYYFSLSLLHNNYLNSMKENGTTSQLFWLPRYSTTSYSPDCLGIGTTGQINRYYWPNK